MVVNCEQVWREVSNYLDGEVDPSVRAAIEEHVRGCKNCTAVLDGTRNVVRLYGDDRMFEVAAGFGPRFHRRLEDNVSGGRRVFFGWMAAAAAAVLVAASWEIGNMPVFRRPALRSEHAQRGNGIPPDMLVAVAEDGKTFHVPTCAFIHDKARLRTIPAAEAIREGYAPCVRCMKQYLTEVSLPDLDDADQSLARSEDPTR